MRLVRLGQAAIDFFPRSRRRCHHSRTTRLFGSDLRSCPRSVAPGDATWASIAHNARVEEVSRLDLSSAKMCQICEDEMGAGNSKLEQLAEAHAELHHYTGEGGLKGIVESNSFHASYFADMNDAHEIRELRTSFEFDLARRLTPLVDRLRKIKPVSHPVWKPGTPTMLANTLVSALYRTIFLEGGDSQKALCCTTSFCSHAADQDYEREHGLLSQWRGYGGSGGYCLVFDTSRLFKMFEIEASQFLYAYTDAQTVHYPRDDTRKLESFDTLLNESERIIFDALSGDRNLNVDDVGLPFLTSATIYKHRGFFEEREVRLVAMACTQLAADEMKKVEGFKPSPLKTVSSTKREGRTDRRYITLFGKSFDALPLRRVIVGPSAHQDQNVATARSIVGEKLPVSKSATPYVG